MNVSLLVVGDEILSGKRRDQHLPKVIDLLRARGMALAEARMIGDAQDRIAEAVRDLRARGDVVLSCGGIGATPDDRTRQAVAQALGVPLRRHAGAEALIVEQFAERAWPNRVLMADFPAGAELIPNPVNRVAGFFIDGVYCVPGFPEMAWPMLEWALDGPLGALHRSNPDIELRLRSFGGAGEGDLLDLMEALLRNFPDVRLSSLPSAGGGELPRHIEFGITGAQPNATLAFEWFRQQLALRADVAVEILPAR